MTELVVAPDAEAAIVSHLNAQLAARNDAATASTVIQDPRPTRFVRTQRVGGPRRNLITDSPVLLFECWDLDTVAASELGRLVEAIVLATDGTWIGTKPVWVDDVGDSSGVVHFPDPDTGLPRYQFTLQLFTVCEAQ
ncbi:hypothetical protein [Rhodococcoides fascians]|uniref:hypothetical protein n=1 Tax=Rhodococcoides fascians TaxID=1828 RepID=UPI00068EC121|nr:hypothetical protein [Rhodococcus fascians]